MLVNAGVSRRCRAEKRTRRTPSGSRISCSMGLLRASFVPPRPQRELREVTRYRSKLVEERARLVNRIQKVLEDSNVKLASVATDITGVSGRAILQALLESQVRSPRRWPSWRGDACAASTTSWRRPCKAHWGSITAFCCAATCASWTFTTPRSPSSITRLPVAWGCQRSQRHDPEPEGAVGPEAASGSRQLSLRSAGRLDSPRSRPRSHLPSRMFSQAEAMRILDEVTGINQRIAEIVLAELGLRLEQFPSEGQLVSWAGLCPAAKISAGKRLSSKTGKGNRWLLARRSSRPRMEPRAASTRTLGPITSDSRNGWAARKPLWL